MQVSFELNKIPGKIEMIGHNTITLLPAGRASSSFFVVLPKSALKERKTTISISVLKYDKTIQNIETNFLGPVIK